MAINAYNKGPVAPGFQPTYQSQYIPLPIEEIQAALYAKQATQNQQLALGQELVQNSRGWKYDPVDKDYMEQAQQVIEQQVSALSQQDLTTREAQAQLQNLVQAASTDKVINTALATGRNRAALVEQINKLTGEGKLHENNAVQAIRAYQQYAQQGGAASGQAYGEYVLAPHVDTQKEADSYFSALQASGSEGAARMALEDGSSIYYKNGQVGVDATRVGKVAADALTSWLSSPAGKQTVNDGLAQGMSEQQAAQYAAEFLFNRGAAHTYSKTTSDLAAAKDKAEDLKRKKKETEDATSMWADLGLQASGEDMPEFENGKVKSTTGAYEVAGAIYSEARKQGKNPLAALAYAGLGGIAHLVNQDGAAGKLEEKYNMRTSPTLKAYEFAKQQGILPPGETEEQYYKRNDKRIDQLMPLITDGKLSRDLGQSLVESGALRNTLIFDQRGRQVDPKTLFKYDGEGKLTSNVGVLTDPQRSFTTADANRAVIVQVDGERYTVDLDGNALMRPMPQRVETREQLDLIDRHNQKMMQRATRDKYVEGVYYDVDKDNNVIPHVGIYHFDASRPHPEFYPTSK